MNKKLLIAIALSLLCAAEAKAALSTVGVNQQYLDCGQPPEMYSSSNVTIMGWVYFNGITADWIDFGMAQLNDNYKVSIVVNNGTVGYNVTAGGNAYAIVNYTGTGWHHLALVWNNSGGTYATKVVPYIDGVVKTYNSTNGSLPTVTATAAQAGDFRIGVEATSTGRWSTGYFDDIRIYPYSLTTTQVYGIFASREKLLDNASREWRLDDGVPGTTFVGLATTQDTKSFQVCTSSNSPTWIGGILSY